MQVENRSTNRRSISLRSVLLIALIVAFGAGATAYALGSVFSAANTTVNNGASLQSTSNTTTATHNCTRTGG
jgi:uncharacterized protein (UPF0333 family)